MAKKRDKKVKKERGTTGRGFIGTLANRFVPKAIYGKEWRTLQPWQLWDFYLAQVLHKNISQSSVTKRYNMYSDFCGFYSGLNNVNFVYVVDDFPMEIENSFVSTLRRECTGNVKLQVVHEMVPHTINWNSAKNKNRFSVWRKQQAEFEEEQIDAFNRFENVGSEDSKSYRKDSLEYLADATQRRGCRLLKRRTIMILSGTRGDLFNETAKQVESKAIDQGIKLRRVTDNIPEHVGGLLPFKTSSMDIKFKKSLNSFIWTDEIIARMSTYTEGTVGKGSLYFGTDIASGFPVAKEPKKDSTDAENWLIIARTGGGKSFMTKGLLGQLLARKDMNGTINDMEGDEYAPLGYLLQSGGDEVVFLDLSEKSKTYFDPVEIHEVGDPLLDDLMYSLSVGITTAMFKSLAGRDIQDESPWVLTILEKQVGRFYSDLGVYADDKESWKKSKGKTIHDVYNKILGYQAQNEDAQKAKDLIVARLENFFGIEGRKQGYFVNQVTLKDIKDAKLVINSFGMRGKSPGTVSQTSLELMQLYAAFISQLRSIFSLAAGKFNFKVWEEFQRYSTLPDAEKIIVPALTGGRKNGDINIIITNKPGDLINGDKFGVFETCTSFAIGAVGDADIRKTLCHKLSIPHMESELGRIEENTSKEMDKGEEGIEGSSPYAKAFLVGLDLTHYTVTKMRLPAHVAQSDLFRTGVKVAE